MVTQRNCFTLAGDPSPNRYVSQGMAFFCLFGSPVRKGMSREINPETGKPYFWLPIGTEERWRWVLEQYELYKDVVVPDGEYWVELNADQPLPISVL
jgi:hypothetical protein